MPLKFVDRHNGPRAQEEQEMLKVLGVNSLEELVRQTVPEDILLKDLLNLSPAVSESQYTAKLKEIASKNRKFRSLIGMGFYGTASPAVIIRNIFENPSWYTSYTPYQAEISQGRLEALINFQTMISSLTGFSLANCSMLDDATASGEAMRMMYELRSRDAVKAGKNVIFVDQNIFPQVLSVMKTRAWGLGIEIHTGDFRTYEFEEKCYGAFVQYPAANGEVRDYAEFCEKAHQAGCLVSAYCDLLSLALLKEPAAWGADIVCGTTQRFGLPMGFGGPAAGYMACSDKYKRNLPGRIIGISVDRLGKNAVRLALQTREQHIKREKATSNICTATALMATMTGMFAIWHGPKGITEIAMNAYGFAHAFAGKLIEAGYKLSTDKFFDTIEIMDAPVEQIRRKAEAAGFNFFYTAEGNIRISFDELSTCEEAKVLGEIFGCKEGCPAAPEKPSFMKRESAILTQKVFNAYHSETEMMRYIKKLERKDISLTHSMIPLGSCTMKLNAAVEMMPLSWSEFGNVHPYAPAEQCEGTMQIIKELEHDLAVITGFDGCSLQPNSGAAGEYAGLMTIRNFHHANGGDNRNIMIIPTSAHGTNPASAAMAGFDIVLVSCDDKGNINVDELREKAAQAGANLAGMMITYPSTHGVFEVKIREIAAIIHKEGGLLYMDGANMNAQVGLTNPGFIGADVCHLNLHKTFAMPHGGGGPGVGPIAVAEKLVDFLPNHALIETGGKNGSQVASAPYGSAYLLPITHGYLKMCGGKGLAEATKYAILNANYIRARLQGHYKILYTGTNGMCAHEMILDCNEFDRTAGVQVGDIAKRLMDYGFHAPTVAFPVHGTLMVEPTESEPLSELDRFCDAMIAIRQEIADIESGKADRENNVIKRAPHTMAVVCADTWDRPYTRQQAAFPMAHEDKYWPTVSKIDDAYGDRNLVCCLDK